MRRFVECRRSKDVAHGEHSSLFVGRLMIVAEEVQKTVGKQKTDLRGDRPTPVFCLFSRGLERDHHISKELNGTDENLGLLGGKGEDIGRPILPAIVAVELMDGPIVGEENGELRLFATEGAEHALAILADACAGNGARAEVLGGDVDGHRFLEREHRISSAMRIRRMEDGAHRRHGRDSRLGATRRVKRRARKVEDEVYTERCLLLGLEA